MYRKLIEGPNWEKMQKLLDEMLNHDCKHSYYKLEQEIMMLKDVIVAPDPSLDQNNPP